MSRSQSAKRPSGSHAYHHGDLRAALLKAARAAAAELGVETLTLREVARRAGVSHAAPYHHFPDKASLLRALAAAAFGELAGALRDAASSAPGSARSKLEAIGAAYVAFALDHPVEFRFMFRRDLCALAGEQEGVEELKRASAAAYQVLLDAIAACQRARLNAAADPRTLALTAWSTVHGLAELLLNDPTASLGPERSTRDAITRAVIGTLHDGLLRGARGGPAARATPKTRT